MHQQKLRSSGTFQKLSFNEHPIISNSNNKFAGDHSSPMLSPTTAATSAHTTATITTHQLQQQMNLINNNVTQQFTRDNKRVSFHDHENNNLVDVGEMSSHDLSTIREDPDVSWAIFFVEMCFNENYFHRDSLTKRRRCFKRQRHPREIPIGAFRCNLHRA